MRIRRYRAKNMQEAILKVKMDLGSDALILNTKKVKQKGILKLFSKPMVEVLAAVDEYSSRQDIKKRTVNEKKKDSYAGNNKYPSNMEEKEEKINYLENKVSSMEKLIKRMINQMNTVSNNIKNDNEKESKSEEKAGIKEGEETLYKRLLNSEIEEKLSERIINTLNERASDTLSINEKILELERIIKGILGEPETINIKGENGPTVVVFVGHTGVGKTTTLAKVAANYSLNHQMNVGLITADTYRIAAVEQLKTYAEILGIPVSVVYSPNEVKEAIKQYSDKDLVLIDTAGRSHKNRDQFEELKQLVNISGADEVYLVLSTTTSIASTREVVKSYNFLNNYKLIFTKIDEAPVIGLILNIRALTGKRLSYITTGQNVPDDIEIANVDKLAKKMLGRMT